MTEAELKSRLRSFGLRVIRLCDALPRSNAGRVIGGQLIRSGTSPGANYRAACKARSLADFVAKLAIAEEEMDESWYWLDMIIGAKLMSAQRVSLLHQEADELTRILTSSRMTAKQHMLRSKQRTKQDKSPIENRKSKIENPPEPTA